MTHKARPRCSAVENTLWGTIANHEVGDDVWFRVQDGGNGGDAVHRSTTYGFKPTLVNTSAEYCALPFDGLPWWSPNSIFPLRHGVINVKPQ